MHMILESMPYILTWMTQDFISALKGNATQRGKKGPLISKQACNKQTQFYMDYLN